MTRRVALAAALVVGIAIALARGLPRGVSPRQRPAPPKVPAAALALPTPVDPATLRDVFQFADEREERSGTPARVRDRRTEEQPARLGPKAPAGPRLVGLVRRGGRLLAALALEGEVELAGPGETAAGVQVLSLDEDSVRVRRPDGGEETLRLE